MLKAVTNNLWLSLTLILPGFVTYGVWRILLLLEPSTRLNINSLNQIDSSIIVSGSIIIAVALQQQAIAIAIEFIIAIIANAKSKTNYWDIFIKDRFSLSVAEKLNENATRIIGNYFMSINMCVGLSLLLVYFMAYERMNFVQWIPLSITGLLVAGCISLLKRKMCAEKAIKQSKKN